MREQSHDVLDVVLVLADEDFLGNDSSQVPRERAVPQTQKVRNTDDVAVDLEVPIVEGPRCRFYAVLNAENWPAQTFQGAIIAHELKHGFQVAIAFVAFNQNNSGPYAAEVIGLAMGAASTFEHVRFVAGLVAVGANSIVWCAC